MQSQWHSSATGASAKHFDGVFLVATLVSLLFPRHEHTNNPLSRFCVFVTTIGFLAASLEIVAIASKTLLRLFLLWVWSRALLFRDKVVLCDAVLTFKFKSPEMHMMSLQFCYATPHNNVIVTVYTIWTIVKSEYMPNIIPETEVIGSLLLDIPRAKVYLAYTPPYYGLCIT